MKKAGLLGCIIAAVCASVPAASQVASGFRMEVRAGADHMKLRRDDIAASGRQTGEAFGIGLGYDIELTESILAGVDFSFVAIANDDCETRAAVKTCVKPRSERALNARLGYRVTDRIVAYGLVGATASRSMVSTTGKRAWDLDKTGLSTGAGLELLFNREYFAGVEFRRVAYSDITRTHAMLRLGLRL